MNIKFSQQCEGVEIKQSKNGKYYYQKESGEIYPRYFKKLNKIKNNIRNGLIKAKHRNIVVDRDKITTKSEYILPYISGFFDGEGSICITSCNSMSSLTRNGKSLVLCASIGCSDDEVLKICKSMFGGGISTEYKKPPHKPIHRWAINSNKALYFIKKIRPYLMLKRKRRVADLAIMFQEHKRAGGRRLRSQGYYRFENRIALNIRKLNKRGI